MASRGKTWRWVAQWAYRTSGRLTGASARAMSASTSSAATVGPTTSAKPVGVRRRPRTGASVRMSRPSPSASGNRPRPPAIPANTGPVVAEPACAAAATRDASPLHATSWGTVARADSSRAWPAYTPPSRGSTSGW